LISQHNSLETDASTGIDDHEAEIEHAVENYIVDRQNPLLPVQFDFLPPNGEWAVPKDVDLQATGTNTMAPGFRQALFRDLREGARLWVRGRAAICQRIDFPLVYWVFDGDDREYHRDFAKYSKLFRVRENQQVSGVIDSAATSPTGGVSSFSGIEAEEDDVPAAIRGVLARRGHVYAKK